MLETTAYAVRHNMEAMTASVEEPRRIVAVGGGARSELLLQIVSDVTGLEQELPAQTIGASYGDAYIAGVAAGLLGSRLRSPAGREFVVAFARSHVGVSSTTASTAYTGTLTVTR
jgi:sugar (pentulose or hexulose) kinase